MPGAKETYDYLCAQYPAKWETSFSNEIGQLAQGVCTRMKRGHIFYNKKSSANWTKKYVSKFSMQLLSLKRQPILRQTNNWWWQSSLPLRLR